MKIYGKNKKLRLNLSATIPFILIIALLPPVFVYQEEEQLIDVIVFFENGVNVDDIPGVDYKYRWANFNGFAGRMSYSTFKELEKSDFVKLIEIDSELYTFNAVHKEESLDWGVDHIDAERVWGGTDGALEVIPGNPSGLGVKVCIIDTGIYFTHDDLNDNYVGGKDLIDGDNYPLDENGHGTMCAGIIGAEDNTIGYIGVAPHVSLYAVRVALSVSDICDALTWAIINEMDVISMSIGTYNDSVIGYLCWAAYQQGIVLVAGAGNDNRGRITMPAAYDEVIAVGAIDENNLRWDGGEYGSNYGPELDFVAPGVGVYTTMNSDIIPYDDGTGTSFACPHIAGVCALILSEHPELPRDNTRPSIVKDILISSCFDLGPPGKDDEYGYGLVNAYAIFDTIPPEVTIISPTHGSDVSRVAVLIEAGASDDLAIKRVRCKIDNNLWLVDDTEAPYQWIWDTTGYSPGSYHTITSIAYDYAGNYAEDQITVRIRTIGGGGGGCPILFVYDGTEYIEEVLLDIHNPEGIDVETIHTLITKPEAINQRYLLRLIEHPKTISHIDKVQLFGRLPHGQLTPLSLTSAVHSALGQVKWTLLLSDDVRVDILGADHNEGSSEFIELEFNAPAQTNFIEFIFVIEGYNIYVK